MEPSLNEAFRYTLRCEGVVDARCEINREFMQIVDALNIRSSNGIMMRTNI